jgi:hypothetical protein
MQAKWRKKTRPPAMTGAAGAALCRAPAAVDNKIERIQSVLRHFLAEIVESGLGKS